MISVTARPWVKDVEPVLEEKCMTLLVGSESWSAASGTAHQGLLWIYSLPEQSIRSVGDSPAIEVPPRHLLITGRSPDRWRREEPQSGDMLLRVDASRWPALTGEVKSLADPGVVLPERSSGVLRHLLEALRDSTSDDVQAPETWREPLLLTIAAFLTEHCRGGRRADSSGDASLQARDQRRLSKLTTYMMSRLGAPLSSEDLARAAGLSVRSLLTLCRRHYRCTPMEVLRNLRLDAVQRHLSDDPDVSIGDIALKVGFGHLGRFSGYYRARFGELPTDTRARRLRTHLVGDGRLLVPFADRRTS